MAAEIDYESCAARLHRRLARRYGSLATQVGLDLRDIVQETLLRVLVARPEGFRSEDEALAYMTTTASRLVCDLARKAKQHSTFDPHADLVERGLGAVVDTATIVIANDDAATVRMALGSLSERHRLVLRRRYVDGYTRARIAKELGISSPAVGALLQRAQDRLRRELRRLRHGAFVFLAGVLRRHQPEPAAVGGFVTGTLVMVWCLTLGVGAAAVDRPTRRTVPGPRRIGAEYPHAGAGGSPRLRTLLSQPPASVPPTDPAGSGGSHRFGTAGRLPDPRIALCAGERCVGGSQSGDRLYVKPDLPIVDKPSFVQDWVPVCHGVPDNPVVGCEPGDPSPSPSSESTP